MWASTDSQLGRTLCDGLWECLLKGVPPSGHLNSAFVESLFPGDAHEDNLLALPVENFVAALLYTLRSYAYGEVDDAVFALEQGTECTDQLAIFLLLDSGGQGSGQPSEEDIVSTPMLAREIQAQERDFAMASSGSDDRAVLLGLRESAGKASFILAEEWRLIMEVNR